STPSTATVGALINLAGALHGNFVIDSTGSLVNTGSGAVGVAVSGPISACDASAMAGVGMSCASTSTGAIVIAGQIHTIGTQIPNVKGGNPEGGSALVIGNNVDGGILIVGP